MNYSFSLLFRKYPMVYLSLAFACGILTALLISNLIGSFIILTISVAVLLFLRNAVAFTIGCLTCVWAFGWCYHVFELEKIQHTAKLIETFHEQDIDGKGIVISQTGTSKGIKLTIKNISISSSNRYQNSELNYFFYTDGPIEVALSDTIVFRGEFRKFNQVRNPGEFNFRSFYHRRYIFGRIFQDQDYPVQVQISSTASALRTLDQIRNSIRNKFHHHTDNNVAGLLSALILGDKSEVDPELRTAFVETGVIHVLAVSGLHVGYVLLILMILTSFFRIPRGWDRLAIIAGLLGFVLLTGGKPSVIRASIMAGLYILAPVINRPVNGWNIIATAAFVILLGNPTAISDLGFLLSFTAVISIIYFYGLFEKVLPEKFKVSRINNKGLKFLWGLFLVSIAAQIGTLPITAYYFGKIPIISLIANVVIVPLVGVLVALGFAILLLGWLPFLGDAFGQSAWLITQGIQLSASVFSSVPFASYPIRQIGGIQVLQYGLLLMSFIFLAHKQLRKKAVLVVGLIINISLWIWATEKRGLEVIFLDVGQGDAAIVRYTNGKNMLIDAGFRYGRKDMGKDVILPVAHYLGISRFNWVVMTHPHSDHIGGFSTIVEEMPIDTVWDSIIDYGSWTYNYLLEEFEEKDIVYVQPQRGDVYRINGSTVIQIFAPDSAWVGHEHNVNNMSIVMRVVYGESSIMFTGDLEYEGDRILLPYGTILDSDVLKIAHHGSITSTTQPFLDLVKPEHAIISVGYKNKFKHPSQIVLDRLEQSGTNIFRTDYDGAIWLRSNGKEFELVSWR